MQHRNITLPCSVVAGDEDAPAEEHHADEPPLTAEGAPSDVGGAAAATELGEPGSAAAGAAQAAGAATSAAAAAAAAAPHAQAAAVRLRRRADVAHTADMPSTRTAVRHRPELQGGGERNAVLMYNRSGPNEVPTGPGELDDAAANGEDVLEDLGSSLGRAVYRR
jgi:hypothetical protein